MPVLLLDSQVALWVLTDGPRLGARARRLITLDPSVHVSAATIWELTIKAMLGKVEVPPELSGRLEQAGLSVLAVSGEHAEAIREFPELLRHDPFDRLIMAQAHVTRARLLTADRVLLALGRDFVVDAGE